MSRQSRRETLPRSANSTHAWFCMPPHVDAAGRRRNVENVEWTAWFDAPEYEFARQVLQRSTATLYFVAFLSSFNQFPALLGERGLLPVPEHLEWFNRLGRPSLFRWRYSDRLLRTVCWGGMAIAATLVAGLPQLGPPWVPLLAFLTLWLLYMSIVNVGQTFYGFGWEMLLLEAGFTVAFLGSDQTPPPRPILILLAWLVFRLEFGAGLIKIRGGRGVAGPDGPVLPPRDPADAGAAEPAGPSAPQGMAPAGGPGQPLRPIGGAVLPFRSPAPGQRRRRDHHLHPALACGERKFRLA